MNCFEWQTHVSDYLDGLLAEPLKSEAEKHLLDCEACKARLDHYRQILAAIEKLPKIPLPEPIRKTPLSFTLPRLGIRATQTRWERAPWFVRSGVEGLAIAVAILGIVATVPRLRALYDRSVERRLDLFMAEDLSTDPSDKAGTDKAPLARGKLPEAGNSENGTEEFLDYVAEEEAGDQNDADESEVRVGSSEIWRFIIKTDSPREMRPKIVQLLHESGIASETPGIGGIEAPGGIQFDILSPQSSVAGIKAQLQKMASQKIAAIAGTSAESPVNEMFTWYKNKSKRKIPPGKARVVIWLSQI